jgi:hypothetical protein
LGDLPTGKFLLYISHFTAVRFANHFLIFSRKRPIAPRNLGFAQGEAVLLGPSICDGVRPIP